MSLSPAIYLRVTFIKCYAKLNGAFELGSAKIKLVNSVCPHITACCSNCTELK